jgi:hypothetical protein
VKFGFTGILAVRRGALPAEIEQRGSPRFFVSPRRASSLRSVFFNGCVATAKTGRPPKGQCGPGARRGRLSFGWVAQVDGTLREEEWMPELRRRLAEGQSLAQLQKFFRAEHGITASRQTIMRALKG